MAILKEDMVSKSTGEILLEKGQNQQPQKLVVLADDKPKAPWSDIWGQ